MIDDYRTAVAGDGESVKVPRTSLPTFPAPPDKKLAGYHPGAKVEKLMIGSLDDLTRGIEAQFNPKELAIDHAVPWKPHHQHRSDSPRLEFTGGAGRTLTLELLFDGYETGQSVEPTVLELANLSRIRDPDSNEEDLLRPHRVAVVFGGGAEAIRPFKGVIESISTKYTMFLPDGRPVRATCSVKIKETDLRRQRGARRARSRR